MEDHDPEEDPFQGPGDSDDELLGATLDDRFRIDELIGAGGMGRVYRGSQLSVERDVAIKILHGELSLDEELKQRFFREAKVVSDFTHPNIVRLIDFGKEEEFGLLYLVMELVQGVGLDELLEEGRFHPELATRIAHQTCGALVEAHGGGVIHRDLKAENLLLSPVSDGTLQTKVVDFGIAYPEEASEKLTRTGRIYGTASYMAPEQARGHRVDRRADLFSLGVLMFEMLTGKLPITGTNSMEVMIKQIQQGPPPLSNVVPHGELPEGVFEIVDRLLAGSPEARPNDAATVRNRLEQVFRGEGWQPIRLDTGRPAVEMFEPWLRPPFEVDEDRTIERPDDENPTPQLGGAPEKDGPMGGTGSGRASDADPPGANSVDSDSPPPADRAGDADRSSSGGRERRRDSDSNRALGAIVAALSILLVVLIALGAYFGSAFLIPDSDSALEEIASPASGGDGESATVGPEDSEGDAASGAPSGPGQTGPGGDESGATTAGAPEIEDSVESTDKDPVCGEIDRDPVPERWRGDYAPREDEGAGRRLEIGAEKLHTRWEAGGATAWVAVSARSGSELEISCARVAGTGEGNRCSGSVRRRGPVLIVRLRGTEPCERRFSGTWLAD